MLVPWEGCRFGGVGCATALGIAHATARTLAYDVSLRTATITLRFTHDKSYSYHGSENIVFDRKQLKAGGTVRDGAEDPRGH